MQGAVGAVGQDLARTRQGAGHQLLGLGDSGHQADALGLLDIDGASGQHELEGTAGADQARQVVADAALTGRQAHLDRAHMEAGRSAGKAHIGAQGQAKPGTYGHPIDGGNHRRVHGAQAPHHAVKDHLQLIRLGGIEPVATLLVEHRLEIQAGAKAPALTGEYQHAHPRVSGQGIELGFEMAHGGHVHGVHA